MNRENDDVIERMYESAKRAGVALSAHFELTRRCNLRCRHCYVCGGDESREMTTAQVLRALDVMAESGVMFVTFTGGEPLLRDDFFEIAERARNKNFAFRVFTNATLLDADAIDKLAELSPLEVGVSLYGVKPETHDSIASAAGAFEKSVGALKALAAKGVPITVKSVLMKPNFAEYGALIEMAAQMGAKYVFDPTVFPRDDGGREPLELRLDDEQLAVVLADERLSARKPGLPQPSVCRGPLCDLSPVSVGISPEGEIFPCLQLRIPVGNINEIEKMSEITQRWEENISPLKQEGNLSGCYNCEVKAYCARCPGLAELEDGSAMGPSAWACRTAALRLKAKNR